MALEVFLVISVAFVLATTSTLALRRHRNVRSGLLRKQAEIRRHWDCTASHRTTASLGLGDLCLYGRAVLIKVCGDVCAG